MKNHTERGTSNPLVLLALAALLALSSLSLALNPMTPAQNGEGWIADDCWAQPDSVRDDYTCVDDKCTNLYPVVMSGGVDVNLGARSDCQSGGYRGIKKHRDHPLGPA